MFQDKSKDSKANPLSVKNIGGVFVVLLAGLLASIIVAVLEFCWNSRKVIILESYFNFIYFQLHSKTTFLMNYQDINSFFLDIELESEYLLQVKLVLMSMGHLFLVEITQLISQQNADEVFSLQMISTLKNSFWHKVGRIKSP